MDGVTAARAEPTPARVPPERKAGDSALPPLAPRPIANGVTLDERKAIRAAFDKHGDRLVEWKFEVPLRQPRLHEVLLALVREGSVIREDSGDGTRYSRGEPL